MLKRIVVLGALALCGCQQSYYRITDLHSGQSFYTKGWLPGMYGRYHSIQFKELGTGDVITIQSSRAKQVSAGEATGATTRPSAR